MTHDLQIRFAQTINKLLRLKNLLRNTAGRDYEGDPKAGAVNIPVRDTEVAITDYDVVTGSALGTSATTYLQVLVDKNKAINELIDGFEAQAVPDNLVAQRLDSGAYQLASAAEADFITALKTGTAATDADASSNTTIYNRISAEIAELLKIGVDISTIKVAITSDMETLLLQDTKYTNTASSIGSERAMDGVINRIRGAEVFRSDKLGIGHDLDGGSTDANDTIEFIVYSTDYAQAGDEWLVMPQINDLKDGVHIGASALQGRWVRKSSPFIQ